MEIALPATVRDAVRLFPVVLGAAVQLTEPDPVVEPPAVRLSQEPLAEAVQEQDDGVVTETLPVVPAAGTDDALFVAV